MLEKLTLDVVAVDASDKEAVDNTMVNAVAADTEDVVVDCGDKVVVTYDSGNGGTGKNGQKHVAEEDPPATTPKVEKSSHGLAFSKHDLQEYIYSAGAAVFLGFGRMVDDETNILPASIFA
ncbi:hypothetical protein RvY_18408 [Ramazzottius varieornatus]|uniref:Uncharacterized protein n=1 Tax=Ramazzottius varieornatus TaxID=947166 RepID=A0A1D1W5Q0_RAMVA|nr:hypothetical protein RvY_18408 [Ramazzottius varieornatus]